MEEQEAKTTKIKKLKKHIRENRKTYITGGVCLITGAVTMLAYLVKHGYAVSDDEIRAIENRWYTDAYKLQWKPETTNITQVISKYGNKLGRPGTPVYDLTDGHRYETIGLAAQDMGYDYNMFRKHLMEGTTVDGHKFIRLNETA